MSRTEKKAKEKKTFKQWICGLKTWQKITLAAATVLVLALLILGIVAYGYLNSIVDEMHEPTPEDYDLSLVDVDGYINILLLGVDSRDMSNLKGTRSDMIMIASINKETNDVKLTSVYRDTYLKLGDTSTYDKITHACVYGGPEMTMKSLNQAMDLNITNYAIVNFKAVADLVDAIGGITVDVQQEEIKQLNKYTKATAKNIGRKNYNLVSEPGVQTLEGVQAVSYGRIRKGVGDDFKRTERMRIVVSKVFEKAKAMPFSELKKIIKMMVPQVKTNLKMNDILALGVRLPQYNISTGSGWPYKWSTGTIKNISYVFPVGLAANTTMLHQEVFGQTDYVPSAKVNRISNEIIARIAAAREANEIEDEKEGESQIETPGTETNPGTGSETGGGTGSETGGETGGGTGSETGGETGGGTGSETGGETGGGTGSETGGETGGGTGSETGGETGGGTGSEGSSPGTPGGEGAA
ncbi:MAG: LCP family protein [Anaerovoracaceae bacterium]